jgi:hypothetical protein
MLSIFQVTMSVWLPERFTEGFAASVSGSLVTEQDVVSALQVATVR